MDSTLEDSADVAAAPPIGDDLSAIAWVHDELRRSLDAAHKSLRRFLRDAEVVTGSDIDSVDPGVLRTARAQIHQGVGALELVGLPAAAIVLRASEAAVQRSVARPQTLTGELVADIERLSFGLLDFLTRILAGKQVTPLALFPQYRAVQEAVEVERIHPADLWTMDWRWREVEKDPDAVSRQPDAAIRARLEAHLLSLMRGTQALTASGKMSDICAGLGAGSGHPQVTTFWNLAAAMFEAQHNGLLPFDVFTKRVASRLLAQFRILQRGDSDVSERLARDLLFFCAQCATPGRGVRLPRLAAVKAAYGLADQVPTDYSVSALGRFDPALIAHAKKRVVAAKEAWSATAGGEMHRLAGLAEQFALVGDSLRKLFPFGESFAAELQTAVGQTQQAEAAPPAPLAMEVATSLLYIEAALDDGDFDNPDHAGRVRRLGERLASVRTGHPPDPLESWMEELYRRVSDRQTMGSVVQELRASLSEVEKAIDQFFRNPSDHGVLVDVPVQLSAMRGVLSVLGMEPAAHALLRMRDEVDGLVSTEVDPERIRQAGVFDRLAGNLSALGFLIDMLSVQPQMAKSLFAYDPESGILAPVMGRAEAAPQQPAPIELRLIEQAQLLAFSSVREDVPLQEVRRDLERLSHEAQAADQPALAAAVLKAQEAIGKAADDPITIASARGELSEALVDFVATATEPAGLEMVSEPTPPKPMKPIALIADLEHDDEMRDVFLEEAREVIAAAQAACTELQTAPGDLTLLTTVRRGFHTLKGSSRMVGLKAFGEAAWACEQAFNAQLAEQRPAEPPLLEFSDWVLAYLEHWVDDIAANQDAGRSEGEVKLAADRLSRRLQGVAVPSDIELPIGLPAGLPTRADLDLTVARGLPGFEPTRSAPDAEAPPGDVAFELDLSGFDSLPDEPAATGALAGLDADGSAMFEPFDAPAEAMQATIFNEQFMPGPASGPVDLDLGAAAGESSPIHPLAPSSQGPAWGETLPGLLLDLSSGEALPDVARMARPMASSVDIVIDDAVDIPTDPFDGSDDHVKIVGPLRIGIPLFNIYLNEADELSRRLTTELAEWAMELHHPLAESPIALAHSLAGSSATVGFTDLSHLARSLEHALTRSQVIGHGTDEEARLFVNAAEEIRRLLHQFAAGFLREPPPELLARLADHERSSALRLEAVTAASELAEGAESVSGVEPAPAVEPMLRLDDLEGDAATSATAGSRADEAAPAAALAATDESSAALTPPAPQPAVPEAAGSGTGRESATLEDGVPSLADADVPSLVDDETTSAAEVPATMTASTVAEVPTLADAEPPATAAQPMAEATSVTPAAESPKAELPEATDEAWPADAPATVHDEAQVSSFGALAPAGALGVAEFKPLGRAPVGAARGAALRSTLGDVDDEIDAVDAVDLELFPIFEEEAQELLPQLASQLRDWAGQTATPTHAAACMRTLHTLKGGARLAGAMRLGEMAHRLETRIERLVGDGADADVADVESLQARADTMTQAFDALRHRDAQAYADAVAAVSEPVATAAPPGPAAIVEKVADTPAPVPSPPPPAPPVEGESKPTGRKGRAARTAVERRPAPAAANDASAAAEAAIDWSRFARSNAAAARPVERAQAISQSAVRVRANLLDRLVNQAGEVSITRSRIESGVGQIKGSLSDLTENLERLRGQLRDIELQGEVQMTSRLEAAKAASQAFDPLEFDRFTRFQELTRMMAESVNDVATVQRTLQRSLESAEDDLVAQGRLTRDLQDDLLRTRMVEFEGLSDRLYRVVRLAAKETGKQVRLDIVGGSIEVDRGVLDRMTAAFEHLLRNCVTHGIEAPDVRTAAGKDPAGSIVVAVSHEGNEVGIEFRDDGAGLDLPRIRQKAEALRLIDPAVAHDDAALANLIFTAGFSTAETVTENAGRGVGMDVVRSDVIAMGGRIETATEAGQGTSFRLILPLTTAVTQVVMLRCGETTIAVPSTLVEVVRRATPAEIGAAYASGSFQIGDRAVPFFWLGALLQLGPRRSEGTERTRSVVVVRSAQQRVVVDVDEVLGNHEVVVKNLGPQLSRLPGLAGMTLLASGAVALIYNPVALATLYGDAARSASLAMPASARGGAAAPAAAAQALAPLVLVVDDSLTVRRVTQRMLAREGYRVTLAKDGLDAIEKLAEEVPQVVLSDIEMPRMDGFDLVRNLRADARWRSLPVIMITSRIAQKHRDHALELGVDHYLGKPYSEEDLLALVARYVGTRAEA